MKNAKWLSSLLWGLLLITFASCSTYQHKSNQVAEDGQATNVAAEENTGRSIDNSEPKQKLIESSDLGRSLIGGGGIRF